MTYILAIDQGTTSSRAILFDKDMRPVQSCQQEFPQYFPQSGWVRFSFNAFFTAHSGSLTCKQL